jgi:hypothetical protein
MTFDLSKYADGTISFEVVQIDTAGNTSAAAMPTLTKDTIAPAAPTLTLPAWINAITQTAVPLTVAGEVGAKVAYSITDGSHTVSGAGTIGSGGSLSLSVNVSTFLDGTLTASATLTDAAGNVGAPGTRTAQKLTVKPAAPTVALNPASDSGTSNSDYITNVNKPQFTTTSGSGTTVAVYVNGVAYTGQTLADGTYTVTAIATDQAGNTSATATAPKTLVIATAGPSGSFTVAGAKTLGGQLSTNSKTPTLTLSFTDAVALSTMATSTNGGTSYGSTVPYATSTTVSLGADGTYTLAVQITDVAGNVKAFTLSVRLDTTGPTISASLSTPQSVTLGYDGTGNISATWSATDASTVATLTAAIDGVTITSGTIDVTTLMAGSHTYTVTAVDGLGNTSTTTVTFQVHPSLAGIQNAVNVGSNKGYMSKTEKTKLLSYLTGSGTTLKANLTSFVNECKSAQAAGTLTANESTLLQSWANDLNSRT